jgi:hypothetical protein
MHQIKLVQWDAIEFAKCTIYTFYFYSYCSLTSGGLEAVKRGNRCGLQKANHAYSARATVHALQYTAAEQRQRAAVDVAGRPFPATAGRVGGTAGKLELARFGWWCRLAPGEATEATAVSWAAAGARPRAGAGLQPDACQTGRRNRSRGAPGALASARTRRMLAKMTAVTTTTATVTSSSAASRARMRRRLATAREEANGGEKETEELTERLTRWPLGV